MQWNPSKSSGHASSVAPPGWWTHWCASRVVCPDSGQRGHWSSVFPPRPSPVCVLYNKTIIISIVLSWILRVILVNHWTWIGCWNHQICSQSIKIVGGLGTSHAAGIWSKSNLAGDCALESVESDANLGWLASEMDCKQYNCFVTNLSVASVHRLALSWLDIEFNRDLWDLSWKWKI